MTYYIHTAKFVHVHVCVCVTSRNDDFGDRRKELKTLPPDEGFEAFRSAVGSWFPGDAQDELSCASFLFQTMSAALLKDGAESHPSFAYMQFAQRWIEQNYSSPVERESEFEALAPPSSSTTGYSETVGEHHADWEYNEETHNGYPPPPDYVPASAADGGLEEEEAAARLRAMAMVGGRDSMGRPYIQEPTAAELQAMKNEKSTESSTAEALEAEAREIQEAAEAEAQRTVDGFQEMNAENVCSIFSHVAYQIYVTEQTRSIHNKTAIIMITVTTCCGIGLTNNSILPTKNYIILTVTLNYIMPIAS